MKYVIVFILTKKITLEATASIRFWHYCLFCRSLHGEWSFCYCCVVSTVAIVVVAITISDASGGLVEWWYWWAFMANIHVPLDVCTIVNVGHSSVSSYCHTRRGHNEHFVHFQPHMADHRLVCVQTSLSVSSNYDDGSEHDHDDYGNDYYCFKWTDR